MSFGAQPRFRISEQTYDFHKAHKLVSSGDYSHRNYSGANISESPPGRSNYWIKKDWVTNPVSHKDEECYRLKMYNTHIHTWWEDGTYQSIYWDSATTRSVLSAFGPVRVWNDSKIRFCDRTRFSPRGYGRESYPYGDGIVVDPYGFIHGVTDFKWVLRDGAKEERSKIRNQLRYNATSRILLGEFGDAFAARKDDVRKSFGRYETGWFAQVPTRYSGVAKLLWQDADHAAIDEAIGNYRLVDGPCRPSKDLAQRAAIEKMADQLLSAGEWYVKKPVPYGNINVRD